MVHAKNPIKQEVRIWSLLGPMLITLILSLDLFRSSLQDALFPALAALGILSIWRWRMYGLALALLVLFGALFYSFPALAAGDRFWSVGISMALGLAFVVLALSFEEVEVLLGGLEEEAGERFQKLTAIDTTLREKELAWSQENSKLIHDLEWTREQSRQTEQQLLQLRQERERLDALLEKTKRDEAEAKEQLKATESSLKLEIETLKVAESSLKGEIERLQKEAALPQVQELPAAPADPFKPRYLQLRDQFNEKSDLLDETRRELFRATEKCALFEREREEGRFTENEEATQLLRQILSMQQERERMERLLRGEISALESLVSHLCK